MLLKDRKKNNTRSQHSRTDREGLQGGQPQQDVGFGEDRPAAPGRMQTFDYVRFWRNPDVHRSALKVFRSCRTMPIYEPAFGLTALRYINMKKIYLTIIILAFSLTAHSTTIRDVLEKYDLCEYQWVFIERGKNGFYFLKVVLPDGMYAATAIVGSHIGKNFGGILEITENDFLLAELFQDKDGDWEEKRTRISVENNRIAQYCRKIHKNYE